MTEIIINVRDLKASIADVLPTMKNAAKSSGGVIAKALVISDGYSVKFQSTDRFIVIESKFHESGETSAAFPEFRFLVDIPSIGILKSLAMTEKLIVDADGFKSSKITFPGDPDDEWPSLHKFMDETWNDPDYFMWEDDGGLTSDAFRPELVKHIKDVLIVPRRNGAGKPSRFYAKDRVRGVIMPTREQG